MARAIRLKDAQNLIDGQQRSVFVPIDARQGVAAMAHLELVSAIDTVNLAFREHPMTLGMQIEVGMALISGAFAHLAAEQLEEVKGVVVDRILATEVATVS